MLDTQKLIMLRAVSTEGSIAAAARALGYTRSAVSQQLSALERVAGTSLLVRTGNRVTLTPVGRTLVDHTERILVELRAAEAALARTGKEVTGRLHVGVPFREGPRIMSSALSEARREYPGLEIQLAAIKDETGAELVHRGQLDMVILSRFGSAHAAVGPGLREWVLGHDALRLCVPTGHRLAGAAGGCSLSDLRDEPWVISPASALGRLMMTLCVAAGFQPTIAATVDDVATALGLVSIGWGVTVAPDLTPANPEGGIQRIRLNGLEAERHSILIVRDGEESLPHISAVIEAVHRAGSRLFHQERPPGGGDPGGP
jgi:DNA-binding transcriptional LysR family regulator